MQPKVSNSNFSCRTQKKKTRRKGHQKCTARSLIDVCRLVYPMHAGSDSAQKRRLARIGVDAFLKMCFKDNFVHGDLHPGGASAYVSPFCAFSCWIDLHIRILLRKNTSIQVASFQIQIIGFQIQSFQIHTSNHVNSRPAHHQARFSILILPNQAISWSSPVWMAASHSSTWASLRS